MARLEVAAEYEMLHALASALHLDYRASRVWVLQQSAVKLLEENVGVPEIRLQDGSRLSVREMAGMHRRARSLGVEFLFERLDFPSQALTRWVTHDCRGGFILSKDQAGPRYKGYPIVRSRIRRSQGLHERYLNRPEAAEPGYPRLESVPHIPTQLGNVIETLFRYESLRVSRDGAMLLRGVAPRPGGWTMRDVLCRASEAIKARDHMIHGLQVQRAKLARDLEQMRQAALRQDGIGRGYPGSKRQRVEEYHGGFAGYAQAGSSVTGEGHGHVACTPYQPANVHQTSLGVHQQQPTQARGIADHVPYSTGPSQAIRDPYQTSHVQAVRDPYQAGASQDASNYQAGSSRGRVLSAEELEALRRDPYAYTPGYENRR